MIIETQREKVYRQRIGSFWISNLECTRLTCSSKMSTQKEFLEITTLQFIEEENWVERVMVRESNDSKEKWKTKEKEEKKKDSRLTIVEFQVISHFELRL